MVAELLRLKARLLFNALRETNSAIWTVIGLLLAGLGIVGLWAGARAAVALDDVTRGRVVVIVSVMLALGAFVVPLVVTRASSLDPRALTLFGMRTSGIAGAVLLTTLVGPALLLVPIAIAPLFLWTGLAAGSATLAIPLIVVEGIFAARLGVVVGSALRRHPAASVLVRVVAAVLLVAGFVLLVAQLAPVIAERLPGSWWQVSLTVVLALAPLRDPRISAALDSSPIGALWRAPLHQSEGRADLAQQDFGIGVLMIAVLAAVWFATLAHALRPTRRIRRERAARVPGRFRALPSTPLGAVAARSFIYWARDPRYRVAFVVVPVVPVVALLAMYIGGIPWGISVLVPLPLVVLLLTWSTLHNDVALDSTAVWAHLAAQTRGVHDRIGRMLPTLAIGAPLVILGTALTAWAGGNPLLAPAILGMSVAVLLGGIGVSSLFSARFPYPATRPGDDAFLQPQVPGVSGGGVQVGSLLLILLVAAPSITACVFFLTGVPGPWNWISLLAGAAAGLLMMVVGIQVGGATFDRRAPELLEFATQH
ncbi:MAG: hypothetical protein ABIR17_11610 [Pseudolysinimonas sp.]|uniref:hypothetical protein n=1 Tax=Pseudolysinimonas sp. TaxID=2680009 RepID=UPI003266B0A7